jgi:hypothetical protein
VRVLVFGSRTFSDRKAVHGFLDLFAVELAEGERMFVINGFASGADRLADEWAGAEENRAQPVRYPAKWSECADDCPHGHLRPNWSGGPYCPTAGHRRNQQMIDEGKPDRAIGFIDKPLAESRGSADMHRRLMAAGIETVLYEAGAKQ